MWGEIPSATLEVYFSSLHLPHSNENHAEPMLGLNQIAWGWYREAFSTQHVPFRKEVEVGRSGSLAASLEPEGGLVLWCGSGV